MAPQKCASTAITISSDEDNAEPSKANKRGKYILIDLTHSEDEEASDSDDKRASDAPKGMFSGKDIKSLIKPLPQRGDAAAGSSKSNARRDAKDGILQRQERSGASGATTGAPGLVQPLELARDRIKASSSRRNVASNAVELQRTEQAEISKEEDMTRRRIEQLEKEIAETAKDREALLAKIGEDLECPMCYDIFKRPSFFTPCGHVFCARCIEQYCRSNGGPRPPGMILREYAPAPRVLRCPTCKEPAPKESKIKREYILQRLVETWNAARGNSS